MWRSQSLCGESRRAEHTILLDVIEALVQNGLFVKAHSAPVRNSEDAQILKHLRTMLAHLLPCFKEDPIVVARLEAIDDPERVRVWPGLAKEETLARSTEGGVEPRRLLERCQLTYDHLEASYGKMVVIGHKNRLH